MSEDDHVIETILKSVGKHLGAIVDQLIMDASELLWCDPASVDAGLQLFLPFVVTLIDDVAGDGIGEEVDAELEEEVWDGGENVGVGLEAALNTGILDNSRHIKLLHSPIHQLDLPGFEGAEEVVED